MKRILIFLLAFISLSAFAQVRVLKTDTIKKLNSTNGVTLSDSVYVTKAAINTLIGTTGTKALKSMNSVNGDFGFTTGVLSVGTPFTYKSTLLDIGQGYQGTAYDSDLRKQTARIWGYATTSAGNNKYAGLDVLYSVAKTSGADGDGYINALAVEPEIRAANTSNWTHAYGMTSLYLGSYTEALSTGTISRVCGIYFSGHYEGMTITNKIGVYIDAPYQPLGNKIGTNWAFYGADNAGKNYFGGPSTINSNLSSGSGLGLLITNNNVNSTTKQALIGVGHYTNAEEPMALFNGESTATANILYIGFGWAVQNCATRINFGTATTQTKQANAADSYAGMASNGNWFFGGYITTPSYLLSLVGTSAKTIGMETVTGTDIAGNNLILNPSASTGTGLGGSFIINLSNGSTSTGTTSNTEAKGLEANARTLADDGTVNLTTSTKGLFLFSVGDGEEYAIVNITSAGTVTLVTNSANVANTDSDTDFCIITGANPVVVKNRLGAEKSFTMLSINGQ